MQKLITFLILLTTLSQAAPLVTIENCTLIPTDWADGDSFQIQIPAVPANANGPGHEARQISIRLYAVDCIENHIRNDSDSRRLNTQRRYFGITNYNSNPQQSINLAIDFGKKGTEETRKLLAKPFTIHTSFADGRGDPKFKRYYAFVTTSDGQDLGSTLVKNGLARAYGVNRQTFDGRSADELEEELDDLELQAAVARTGVWKYTDWKTLPIQRQKERNEQKELELAKNHNKAALPIGKLHINNAPLDDLLKLPGIGPVTANKIIQNRPYKTPADLQNKVKGIGQGTLKNLLPYLTFPNNPPTSISQ